MSRVIDLQEVRFRAAVKRGYRNWVSRFGEPFGPDTRFTDMSMETLSYLAQGKDKGTFYLYDLIMNLKGLGTGFEFNELTPKNKMVVIDLYLFVLDQVRFECMKRLEWIERYPGEAHALAELIDQYNDLAPRLQAKIPELSRTHPGYDEYRELNTFDQEGFIRKLIPKALKAVEDYASTR